MTQVTLKQDGKTLTALLSGEIDHHKLVSAMGGVVVVQKAPKDIKRMLSIAGIESKD